MLIEWKESRGLNRTYTWNNMTLLRGLQPAALSTVPTGFLEESMSSVQAKGPSLLPQCQQSLWADGNLGRPRARQGTCNNSIDTQSDTYRPCNWSPWAAPPPPPPGPFVRSLSLFCLNLLFPHSLFCFSSSLSGNESRCQPIPFIPTISTTSHVRLVPGKVMRAGNTVC